MVLRAAGKITAAPSVRLTLPNGVSYPLDGAVDYISADVGQGTDTVTVRAPTPPPPGDHRGAEQGTARRRRRRGAGRLMLSDIFIARPRLAAVISIVLTLAGLIALRALPIAQYPDIVPQQVSVTASYPGAGADVVETTVPQPIEARVVGDDDMLYMKSTRARTDRIRSRSPSPSAPIPTSLPSTSRTASRWRRRAFRRK